MDVYSLDCPFFHPDDVIQDHGGTLHRDSSDNYGIPKLSHWAFIACRHGEHTRRKGSIASKRNVMKWIAFGLKDFRQIEIERPKLEKMSVILADQLIDNAVIESTVNKKRSLIKVKDSGVLDNLISDCYKFYSAVNSGGGTHTLEFIELNKFLSETSILGEEHSSTILRILSSLIATSVQRTGNLKSSLASIPRPEIHRHEFFLALIKISIFKFITLPKKEIARLKRQGQHVSNSNRNVPTAPKALELVLVYDQHLAPVIANMPAGAKMRDAVASKEVLILMYDNLESLKACFEKFAQMKSEDGSISLSEFSVFAMSAGFCGEKTNKGVTVTPKDIRQIFSASKNDRPEEVEENNGENVSHYEVMSFSEFVEAIARLGVKKMLRRAQEL
ncbi:hypothetical protein QTG54_014326 [Skeletonema marinoi]|uniref:EF-hand domain-containing protein n=1 Tax=Skeletonema marinoi TaxID=267567 RepID=A0AAD8XX19_9STRA|nr:hypothetical protein QTG54_014326 [Skeletonema marinoi]